ncbi:hypothetical protein Nepgr_027515 [Nepenthes gracilis]|uniref:Uncharacterized protein n=1 Tax=Nepenthes gracilis TaxID=150966 RepID=A0AAD3TA84_NEPGR|nr:hypothetical protein Nepgr_027515 [Nepenthes gracilis]
MIHIWKLRGTLNMEDLSIRMQGCLLGEAIADTKTIYTFDLQSLIAAKNQHRGKRRESLLQSRRTEQQSKIALSFLSIHGCALIHSYIQRMKKMKRAGKGNRSKTEITHGHLVFFRCSSSH